MLICDFDSACQALAELVGDMVIVLSQAAELSAQAVDGERGHGKLATAANLAELEFAVHAVQGAGGGVRGGARAMQGSMRESTRLWARSEDGEWVCLAA